MASSSSRLSSSRTRSRMPKRSRSRKHCVRQEERIEALKRQVERASNGMLAWNSDELSLDQQEQFWSHILRFEMAPSTSDYTRLLEAGVELPHPDLMSDDRVGSKVLEVANALAQLCVFMTHTDHLSDRDLYRFLWHKVL